MPNEKATLDIQKIILICYLVVLNVDVQNEPWVFLFEMYTLFSKFSLLLSKLNVMLSSATFTENKFEIFLIHLLIPK